MTNNDILRRLRFIFDFSNSKVIKIFAKVQQDMAEDRLLAMLKKEEEDGYSACNDITLCQFLDGLILDKRGLKPGAELPKPTALNNNLIFKKLRIALELKEEDIIAILKLADFNLGKSELGALFRNPDHKHFKPCGDQILRNFLKGLSLKHRGL
ncbi:YehS family protein [Shewanella cyperi]|uniref:DUF1456 family protein n=1 Tax=Shewanella cyperi TaxID=2814292 RepID=A0A974XJ35_9GAMM|nr:DUF1456 family protein [Shewanella cyperi]QSX29219.1 DUF1456 family protein [Shewanella cyperi]QSX39965.1 DUF1456 family protein [Shewanella cyperi]